MARKFRILFLMFLLATVAHQAWWQSRDLTWDDNLYIAVHPVNADGSESVTHYLEALQVSDFDAISQYFAEQAQDYGLTLYEPLAIRLGPTVNEVPPALPQTRSTWQAIRWSLQFRYWAWRHSPSMPVQPDIRIYLLYYDPDRMSTLPHSTALQKGRLGQVNLYGEPTYSEQNTVIIAHEVLHTLGATDKYDFETNLPNFPIGFADPTRSPRYPQLVAELMAGRVPLTAATARIPENLHETAIGQATAREIGWVR